MNRCKLCNKETTGSVGASGLRWKMICQECKDKEDSYANDKIKYECKMFSMIKDSMIGGGSQ